MTIPAEIIESLHTALVAAITSRGELGMFVRLQLGMRLTTITGDGPLPQALFDLILVAEDRHFVPKLAERMIAKYPQTPQVLVFKQDFWAKLEHIGQQSPHLMGRTRVLDLPHTHREAIERAFREMPTEENQLPPILNALAAKNPSVERAVAEVDPGSRSSAVLGSLLALQPPGEALSQLVASMLVDHPFLESASREIDRRIRDINVALTASEATEASHLSGGRVYIDRENCRVLLKKFLQTPNGPCVMTVNGTDLTGRSYTKFLIAHAAESRGFRVMQLPVMPSTGPQEIARRVLTFMDVEFDSTDLDAEFEQEATHIERLAERVVAGALSDSNPWCLIIDGIAQVGLSDQVSSFLHHIATMIELGEANRHLRLALIEYEGTISRIDGGSMLEDSTFPPDRIGVRELTKWFENLCGQYGEPIDDQKVAKAVTAVLSEVPVNAPDRMNQLRKVVEVAAPQFYSE